jgi:hypothetical protein
MSVRRALSDNELELVRQALLARHQPRLRAGETLHVAHRHEQGQEFLVVEVVLGAEHFRFEAATHHEDTHADTSTEQMVDFVDSVLGEWLEGDREAYPTLDFSPYEFRGVTVGLRGGPHRPDLEAMADEILMRADPLRNGHRNGHGHDH